LEIVELRNRDSEREREMDILYLLLFSDVFISFSLGITERKKGEKEDESLNLSRKVLGGR
jgi:hypothetical protein